jgi:hypothetical protein
MDTNKLEQLSKQAEEFMIREMNCGANLPKLEQYENDFAAWKVANGFHHADDCESILDELYAKMN